ncbi:MAG: chaperone NapD, partial [Calditrichia bacterium]
LMPIAGVVILAHPAAAPLILEQLQALPQVTTYGVHKENNIVAVLEADDAAGLERLSKNISSRIPGILGVFPSYVDFEEDQKSVLVRENGEVEE